MNKPLRLSHPLIKIINNSLIDLPAPANIDYDYIDYDYFFPVIFLVFSVCEGALGLSILVSMIRSHGNDFFNSFGLSLC